MRSLITLLEGFYNNVNKLGKAAFDIIDKSISVGRFEKSNIISVDSDTSKSFIFSYKYDSTDKVFNIEVTYRDRRYYYKLSLKQELIISHLNKVDDGQYIANVQVIRNNYKIKRKNVGIVINFVRKGEYKNAYYLYIAMEYKKTNDKFVLEPYAVQFHKEGELDYDKHTCDNFVVELVDVKDAKDFPLK